MRKFINFSITKILREIIQSRCPFDGHRINDDETPKQLEIEQDDVIEVYQFSNEVCKFTNFSAHQILREILTNKIGFTCSYCNCNSMTVNDAFQRAQKYVYL